MLMSGSVAFESLILGEAASEKIGYRPNRAYQIQSGLANLATALTALLVYMLDWGRYADATIVSVMLMFFTLSHFQIYPSPQMLYASIKICYSGKANGKRAWPA